MKKITMLAALLISSLIISGCNKVETEPDSGAEVQKGTVLELDDTSFDAAIANGVVLVDFWATWCPPCRKQLPLVDEAAAQLDGIAKVAKVNVDVGKNIAAKFKIASIPTLIVFKDGKEVKKFVGVTQSADLVAAVKAAL